MKKILSFFMTFLVLAFVVQSCGRDGDTPAVPTDETKDRGHEMPNKIELIMTDLSTNQQHKKVGVLTPNGVVYDDETPFVWKAGGKYHFDIGDTWAEELLYVSDDAYSENHENEDESEIRDIVFEKYPHINYDNAGEIEGEIAGDKKLFEKYPALVKEICDLR